MPTVPSTEATTDHPQIHRAKVLERERAELMERIAKNREYLRLMDANGDLTDAQSDWLADFYPLKEKGERRSEEDIIATRNAKLEARKSHKAE